MLIVALTGGIATGKSIVARTLENLGCYIHPADSIAHQLMEPDKPAWKKIVEHFGEEILNPDRTVNRAMLASIIFRSREKRKFLNALIHPLVLEEKRKTISALRKEGKYNIFVSEAALTIESGFSRFFDRIIVTYCREEEQIKRLKERDGLSRKEALQRIKAQMPTLEKVKFADYTIDTSGPLLNSIEQTERVYRQLIQDYELLYRKK
ncbi:MAG: dephospho-CoA kinase [Candidatus Aminicenantales bacterium]